MTQSRTDNTSGKKPAPAKASGSARSGKARNEKGHASGPNGAGAYAEPGFERPKSKSTGEE